MNQPKLTDLLLHNWTRIIEFVNLTGFMSTKQIQKCVLFIIHSNLVLHETHKVLVEETAYKTNKDIFCIVENLI